MNSKKGHHDFGNGIRVPAHRHPNGGGWVADSATVDGSVYVGPNAGVHQLANVFGDCKIKGHSRVFGWAKLSGNVTVSGHASIEGASRCRDNVIVSGRSRVLGGCYITDNAKIKDNSTVITCHIGGNVEICKDAYLIDCELRSGKHTKQPLQAIIGDWIACMESMNRITINLHTMSYNQWYYNLDEILLLDKELFNSGLTDSYKVSILDFLEACKRHHTNTY
jgi:carbonic anhydrase/acetyltransferase-like protein (isoleucine patch superfamily)